MIGSILCVDPMTAARQSMSDDFKKHEGKGDIHQGEARSAPYPVSRLAATVDLVDIARQISQADAMVNTKVSAKLQLIAGQIQALQEEARKVLEQARQDQALHRAQCNFKRIPGRIYHLYGRADGSRYFSMLGPEEWGGKPPHEFIGSYRLENDMSWTPAERVADEADEQALIHKLLSDHDLLP